MHSTLKHTLRHSLSLCHYDTLSCLVMSCRVNLHLTWFDWTHAHACTSHLETQLCHRLPQWHVFMSGHVMWCHVILHLTWFDLRIHSCAWCTAHTHTLERIASQFVTLSLWHIFMSFHVMWCHVILHLIWFDSTHVHACTTHPLNAHLKVTIVTHYHDMSCHASLTRF